MPALMAEESMRRVQEHAIGAGVMRKEDQRAVLAQWRKAAGAGAATRRKLTRDQAAIRLASIGIGVERRGDGNPG